AVAGRQRQRLNRLASTKRPYKAVAGQYVRAKVKVFASYNNRLEAVVVGKRGLLALKSPFARSQ
ncbi:MAG TPA: hypothetical protein VIK28_10750, partial [Sedimentisphaerales bacterium]